MSQFIEERRRSELALQVKLVLANAGIPQPAFAKTLCDVLGIAIAQAYRKLSAKSDYTLPQIAAIEDHFKVELLALANTNGQVGMIKSASWVQATLNIDSADIPCHIVVGAAWRTPPRCPFAAYLERGHWRVLVATQADDGHPFFEVDKLSWSSSTEMPAAEG